LLVSFDESATVGILAEGNGETLFEAASRELIAQWLMT